MTTATLTSTPALALDELLRESPAAVVARERETFERLAGPAPRALVLLGAGNLGRRTATRLRAAGIEVAAFADNNPAAHGRVIDGLDVVSPATALERFGERATFVVTIWGSGSGHRFDRTRDQLRALGATRIVPAAALFWTMPERFLPFYAMDLPSKVIAARDAVRAGFDLLADDDSRAEFVRQLRWRLHLDFDALRTPVHRDEYFAPDLFAPREDEVFVDCGAYDGDTVKRFLAFSGGRFRRIFALEPDPATLVRLRQFVAGLAPEIASRIEVLPLAAADRDGTLRFAADGSLSSAAGATGEIEVEARRLDGMLGDAAPTLLKMDIEGAEPGALEGARDAIRRGRPVLAVCAYHVQDHLWSLPAQVRALAPDHRLHLRAHGEECWDVVLYAVPPERSARA